MEAPIHMSRSDELLVPVSIGEVADKITILEIKETEIKDAAKLVNVRKELKALRASYLDHVGVVSDAVDALTQQLRAVNRKLWVIEDDIRDCERAKDFGAEFIRLARAVYVTNDERARLKREINVALGSAFIEEKSYADHGAGPSAGQPEAAPRHG